MFNTEQKRIQKLRLSWFKHTQEKTCNIAKTCRYFGISRQTYYKWQIRYASLGKSGLTNQSKKTHNPPPTTNLKIRKIIKNLRLNHRWGSTRIKRWLATRYNINLGLSTVYKILKKYKINRLSLLKKR